MAYDSMKEGSYSYISGMSINHTDHQIQTFFQQSYLGHEESAEEERAIQGSLEELNEKHDIEVAALKNEIKRLEDLDQLKKVESECAQV
nr:unnamed protein product [Callosobruchus chinensis]